MNIQLFLHRNCHLKKKLEHSVHHIINFSQITFVLVKKMYQNHDRQWLRTPGRSQRCGEPVRVRLVAPLPSSTVAAVSTNGRPLPFGPSTIRVTCDSWRDRGVTQWSVRCVRVSACARSTVAPAGSADRETSCVVRGPAAIIAVATDNFGSLDDLTKVLFGKHLT